MPFDAYSSIGYNQYWLSNAPVNGGYVGPFSGSNYYTQNPSPMNLTTGPWTVGLVFIPTDFASAYIMLNSGVTLTNGWYVQYTGGGNANIYFNNGLGTTVTTGNTAVLNTVNILLFGIDASGNAFIKLNNGATVSQSSFTITAGAATAWIGYDSAGVGAYAGGNIVELWASTDVPSSAAFTALYNTFSNSIAGKTLLQLKAVTNNVSSLGYGGSDLSSFYAANSSGVTLTQPQQTLSDHGYAVVQYILDPTTGQIIPNP
jgi:hypothetical protein